METKLYNITINNDTETKNISNKIIKEIKCFCDKNHKILCLDKQKKIEINIMNSKEMKISVTNRMINVNIFENNNPASIAILLINKIVQILEKEKVFVPDYIKQQINNDFDLKEQIKKNKIDTNKIIKELDKN